MFVTPVITAAQLGEGGTLDDVLVLDASFQLSDPQAGRRAYAVGHLPGAIFVDLNRDLCCWDPARALSGGRHPLPPRADIARTFARLGVTPERRVVVYDRGDTAGAARTWWMLRFIGHAEVAVLSGGFAAWQAAGLPVRDGAPGGAGATPSSPSDGLTYSHGADPASGIQRSNGRDEDALDRRARQLLRPALVRRVDIAQVANRDTDTVLLDARGPARWRGETEPIDRCPGHIPGALNLPFARMFDADGCFLPPAQIREVWRQALGPAAATRPARVISSCGSGITAAILVLAAEYAGLDMPALYGGSYSEWSADPGRPIETGA